MRYKDIILAKALGKGAKGALAGWPYMLGVSGGGTATTVTGVSPLALALAVNGALTSLTQTGLCTQASTPTPAAPVDIKCNNGRLVAVDDELPAAYKRVLGFSMNDNCYWKLTDFKLKGSDTLRFSFSATTSCNVIGAYSGSATGNNYSLYVSTASGNYLRYKGDAYNSTIDADTRYDVVITPTGTTGMKTNSSWSALEFTTTTDFCVGTTSTNTTSAKMKGSFYGDIIVDGRLHLVPCERVSDNMLGYYDLEGETFYAPTSGTPTSLGYDGSHYSLAVVGTNEVITLGEQTASAVDLLGVGDYADTQEIVSGAVTRKVGIKVFDGTENISTSNACFTIPINDRVTSKTALLCSHFPYSTKTSSQTDDETVISFSSTNIGFRYDACANKAAFAAWLKEQYDAGTPVIVIYPLAEQTTESVAAQPLHTHKGAENVITVTAEVSDISLTAVYKANSKYTALDSLEFDGSFYFKTGVVPTTFDYEVELDGAFTATNTSSPVVAWGYMGNNSSMPRWQVAAYSSKWLMAVNATTWTGTYDTDRHTFKTTVFDDGGTAKFNAYLDGTKIQTDTAIGNHTLFQSNTWEAYIGCRNNADSVGNKWKGVFYSLKIRKAGAQVHHYIPVTRASDNAVGLYDYTTDSFIEKTAA